MEGLREKIKESSNLPCTKEWCRTMYEISQYCSENPERAKNLEHFIKNGICKYNTADSKQRNVVFGDYGPTPQECIDFNCFLPFILKSLAMGKN